MGVCCPRYACFQLVNNKNVRSSMSVQTIKIKNTKRKGTAHPIYMNVRFTPYCVCATNFADIKCATHSFPKTPCSKKLLILFLHITRVSQNSAGNGNANKPVSWFAKNLFKHNKRATHAYLLGFLTGSLACYIYDSLCQPCGFIFGACAANLAQSCVSVSEMSVTHLSVRMCSVNITPNREFVSI